MHNPPEKLYLDLMSVIRERLDVVAILAATSSNDFARAETAAFHGRKVIEGIAFGCLVATERGIKHVPRDAKGQWNAESILRSLDTKDIKTFPNPSILRQPTEAERQSNTVTATVEGVPERRISNTELIAMYSRMHSWLHELNPYVTSDQNAFYSKNGQKLWDDLSKIDRFIERHFISISGHGFYCVLRDTVDGHTKVLPLSR